MLREILNAGKTGIAPDMKTLTEGKYFFRLEEKERELTGALPLRFRSGGSDLLDWRITGAEGGAGKVGLNYLKQEELEVSDGGSGTITYTFCDYVTAIALEDHLPDTPECQQWVWPAYSRHEKIGSFYVVCEERVPCYENCFWFADLKAGTYKLMADFNSAVNRYDYYGRNSDRLDDTAKSKGRYPFVSLFRPGEDEPVFTTRILEDPLKQQFIHEEYTFTLDEDSKIGFFAVFPYVSRFMIVDGDVEATRPLRLTDELTCWEPFHYVLPITVTCGDKSETIVIDLGQELLGPEDSISLAEKGVAIPTFKGWNTIDSDADIKPSEMYIKYRG